MKRIAVLSGLLGLSFLAAGCGGGGGALYYGAPPPTPQASLIAVCDTTNPVYTDVNAGDTVTPITTGTELEILHLESGQRRVCVTTGAARLEITTAAES